MNESAMQTKIAFFKLYFLDGSFTRRRHNIHDYVDIFISRENDIGRNETLCAMLLVDAHRAFQFEEKW